MFRWIHAQIKILKMCNYFLPVTSLVAIAQGLEWTILMMMMMLTLKMNHVMG